MNFKKYPFLKFLLPFVAGIIVASNLTVSISYFHLKILVVALFLLLLILLLLNSIINFKFRWIWGLIVFTIIFISSSLLMYSHRSIEYENTLTNIKDKTCNFKILIDEPIEIKNKSVKVIAKILSYKNGIYWEKTFGKALVYIEKDNASEKLKYGDEIIINAQFYEIKEPQNPYQFNYKKYLSNKKIFYQTYVKSDRWVKSASGKGNLIKSLAVELRQKLLDILYKNNIKGEEYAVISAVLLGQTDKIEPDLYQTYVNSGAVHVLAVSGMHVGIIFLTLTTLLSFLDKINNGRIIKAVLSIVVIWFYAMITGLSPSVVRASTMITFIVIGRSLNRSFNIYNIIFASAFILLLYNPLLLFEIGFQLSFLAVAGIVIFHEELYKIWVPKTTIVDKLWSVTCVSIAAQLATSPISLFYFNQFPNYFLISNILVFLFSSIIICTGILVLVFSFLNIISNTFAMVLVELIKYFNLSLTYVEKIPYSVTTGINISTIEAATIYLVIIALFFYYFKNRYSVNLKIALVFIIFLQIIDISKLQSYNNQRKIIVYSIPNNRNIEYIEGRKSVLFSSSKIDEKTYNFYIKKNHIKAGLLNFKNEILSDTSFLSESNVFAKNNIFLFGNKRIVLVNNSDFLRNSVLRNGKNKLEVDLLVISNNSVFSIDKLLNFYKPKKIIIDTTNKNWLANRLSKECENYKLPYHNILQSGAYLFKNDL